MLATRKTTGQWHAVHAAVDALASWGMAILLTSFLFLFIDYELGGHDGTGPTFIIGLFALAAAATALRALLEGRKIR
jgi:ABC-type transport system involved in cytochrome c biogenesis permease component